MIGIKNSNNSVDICPSYKRSQFLGAPLRLICSGKLIFALIATIVFVVTYSLTFWFQWQSTYPSGPDNNSMINDAPQEVIVIPVAGLQTVDRKKEQNLRHLQEGEIQGENKEQNALPDEAEQQVVNGMLSNIQHEQWQDNFYAQLHSPKITAMAADEDLSRVISGRVLTRLGNPVSGIEVNAQLRQYIKTAKENTPGNSNAGQLTRTNDNGFYAFRNMPGEIYLVGTSQSGRYAPSRIEVHTGVKYADLVLDVQESIQVIGTVTDTMGMELEGVRVMPMVKGVPEGAVSDTEGVFEFTVDLQGDSRSFPVRFQREGYREIRHHFSESNWGQGDNSAFMIKMEPIYETVMVSGSLKDTAGTQVVGETVRLYSPGLKRNYRALSDEAGEYLFAKVEVANDYQLWVRPTGPYRDFTEQNLVLGEGSLRREIELESLQRGYRLSGRILDQDRRPVPDFTLTLRSKAATGQILPVTSDNDGDFQVENVPEGELVIESRTMPYYTLTGISLSGDSKEHRVNLVVNRGQHKLLGTVVDSDGRPVATPKVFITSSQVINGIRSQSSSTTSADARGHFLFTDLGAGQHTVTVNAPGYEGVRLKPVVGVGMHDQLVIQLEKNSI